MILVNYTDEEVNGLPGPNIFIHDGSNSFESLSFEVQRLFEDDYKLIINELDYVRIGERPILVEFRSTRGAKDVFLDISKGTLLVNLDHRLWKDVLVWCMQLARSSSSITIFFEFENIVLNENCNIILEN